MITDKPVDRIVRQLHSHDIAKLVIGRATTRDACSGDGSVKEFALAVYDETLLAVFFRLESKLPAGKAQKILCDVIDDLRGENNGYHP